MAFNFNWSPLMADAGFYTRAQDLLTAALNKLPKPPIIVDDVVVTELNLGSVPPELEILEIGDLAEDRFRGIFKMSYSGDAFLTLKTRVQANPLNTYMATRPSYSSMMPLAAATGLTIPLQLTLSNFQLSGFVVLVFSKQKGITLVFRNDPLESLKVSSTFDSIPSVRDYLQREIEGQLRILFMDELPAIIHRLSLRLWVPEYRGQEPGVLQVTSDLTMGPGEDPLLSPPKDPVDASGNILSSAAIASLSLDSGVEMHSLFSKKNLLSLATLMDSQRTLSLFTPSIREVMFRARTGYAEQGEGLVSGLVSPTSPALSRAHSHVSSQAQSIADTASVSSLHPRSSTPISSFSGYGLSLGAGRHSKARPSRKRKKRVIDLRKTEKPDEEVSVSGETAYSESTRGSAAFSQATIPEEQNDDPVTPPFSPENTARVSSLQNTLAVPIDSKGRKRAPIPQQFRYGETSSAAFNSNSTTADLPKSARADGIKSAPHQESFTSEIYSDTREKGKDKMASYHEPVSGPPSFTEASHSSNILEQAWMMKMAGEIARRIQEGKYATDNGYPAFWEPRAREDAPPPAYGH